MRFIVDLHIHSHYSRATSRDMTPEGIWKWAQLKGVAVIGTGDFTHPKWFKELNEKLESPGNGLFTLKTNFQSADVPVSCTSDVSFILSAEISCIYSKQGRTRKVHSVVVVPDFASAARLNLALSKIGNLSADGRPILGLDAKELLRIVLDVSPEALYIPAHAWTPHFSVFGAASGFDSLEECYEELTPHIHAIETGLSSDPLMNWRISSLDRLTLVSNSDAHSTRKMGREANILDTDISYASIINAVKSRKGFLGTIEFFPEEGKYHGDGHRACGVTSCPEDTIRNEYRCPSCGGKVTVGVMHRVGKLADRKLGYRPPDAPFFHSIVPLQEIIAESLRVGTASKKVEAFYFSMLSKLGNEFKILMDVPRREIEQAGFPLMAEAISRMRSGNVSITPGYDGEYGKIKIFGDGDLKERTDQIPLL